MSIELANSSKIECVLDTGFYGSLLLPREFVESNALKITGSEKVVMIEDNVIEISTAKAELKWLGNEFAISVLVSETNEALIGVELLDDSLLEIDYRNGSVKITK